MTERRVVEGPSTKAGRRLIFEYRHWFAEQGWDAEGWDPEASAAELTLDVLAIEAAARAEAGHRITEDHDCFLMNCARLGDEVRRLQVQVTEAAQAARAEVIAEIRAGVEGLPFEVPDEPSASSRFMARALVNRDEVLALLPPTEPKS